MNWYIEVLKKYAVFTGRARRKEYWMFVLFNFIISLVLSYIARLAGGSNIIGYIYSLAVFVPSVAVGVRRLHDTNRTGWWLLIMFLPLIGAIVIIVFMVLDSDDVKNQYGENPKINT